MVESDSSSENKLASQKLDLSSLESLSLGPSWVTGKSSKPAAAPAEKSARGGDVQPKRRSERPPRRERREPREFRGAREDRREERREEEVFRPVVHADFYPEEEPFKVLIQAIRTSMRTFELFEIARLILDKPERFVVVLKDPEQKEGEPARLWATVTDGLPFRTEEEALSHVFKHQCETYFTMETVETEAPAGQFNLVHKCGITGALLAPPNYHRYQALCRQHHASHLAHMPYERFMQKIETVKEPEEIQAWLDQMKKQTRYTLKPEYSGGETVVFENLEDARLYMMTRAKDKMVRPAYSARFSGRDLDKLPAGSVLRRSVEFLWEQQKRFPLDTANHLRGRLRRLHFAVYKKGSKGVSYVCSVKRRFRKAGEVMSDNLEDLISFIEAHTYFPAKDLPKGYLGMEEIPVAAKEEGAEAPKMDAASAQRLKDLKCDLRYLVSEGYVIEYSDGRLFVPPAREDGKEDRDESDADEPAGKEKEESAKAKVAEITPEPEAEAEVETAIQAEPVAKAEPVVEPEPVAEAEPEPEAVPEIKAEETTPEPEPDAEVGPVIEEAEPETKVEVEAEAETEADAEPEAEKEAEKLPVKPIIPEAEPVKKAGE